MATRRKTTSTTTGSKSGVLSIDLSEMAKEILQRAEEKGVEHSYLFVTTFKRYQEHIRHLAALEKVIAEEGMLTEKEYVKGRKNLYINPAVSAYNQSSGAADKTAQLLIRYIVAPLKDEDADGGDTFDGF